MDVIAFPTAYPPEDNQHEQTAIALAEEGVPLSAIARVLREPYERVVGWVKAAIEDGRIVDMVKTDWPPHTRAQRTPQYLQTLSDETRRFACMSLFKIPRTQAVVLLALLSRPSAKREYLHTALLNARTNQDEKETKIKMVDVVLCNLRNRMKQHGIEIETIWGEGYQLTEASRDAINNALKQHVRALVLPEDEKEAA